jgi:hypothetical protein
MQKQYKTMMLDCDLCSVRPDKQFSSEHISDTGKAFQMRVTTYENQSPEECKVTEMMSVNVNAHLRCLIHSTFATGRSWMARYGANILMTNISFMSKIQLAEAASHKLFVVPFKVLTHTSNSTHYSKSTLCSQQHLVFCGV